jgi:hypothetical protein
MYMGNLGLDISVTLEITEITSFAFSVGGLYIVICKANLILAHLVTSDS